MWRGCCCCVITDAEVLQSRGTAAAAAGRCVHGKDHCCCCRQACCVFLLISNSTAWVFACLPCCTSGNCSVSRCLLYAGGPSGKHASGDHIELLKVYTLLMFTNSPIVVLLTATWTCCVCCSRRSKPASEQTLSVHRSRLCAHQMVICRDQNPQQVHVGSKSAQHEAQSSKLSCCCDANRIPRTRCCPPLPTLLCLKNMSVIHHASCSSMSCRASAYCADHKANISETRARVQSLCLGRCLCVQRGPDSSWPNQTNWAHRPLATVIYPLVVSVDLLFLGFMCYSWASGRRNIICVHQSGHSIDYGPHMCTVRCQLHCSAPQWA
jgi:hypothetical protein